jgi:hypothetical protein
MSDEKKNFLEDRKVKLIAVPRAGAMINDPDHIGYFMYNDTKKSFCLPKSISRRTLYPLLNEAEKEFFEKKLDLDLNIYKKEDNFWHTFRVEVTKDDGFMKNGYTFDLSDPMDNLKVRLLRIQEEVAPSWEERFDRGEYKFALVDVGHEDVMRVSKATKNEKAYKHLSKISGSADLLYDFLSIYSLQNPKAKRPSAEATRDSLYSQAQELIENDIKGFLEISEDEDYDIKLLVHRAIGVGAINKNYTTREFFMPEGKYLGNNLDATISALRSPEYQEDFLRIKAVVSASTGEAKETVSKKKASK